jgi:hypothetical protein
MGPGISKREHASPACRTPDSGVVHNDPGLDAVPSAEAARTPRLRQSNAPTRATCFVAILVWLVSGGLPAADAQTLPQGFVESIVFSGLTIPSAVVFLNNDGRAFVAEKSGVIEVFDSLSATTPTVYRARHRNMQVDPANRLVADSLEADWNGRLLGDHRVGVLHGWQRPSGCLRQRCRP